MQEQPTSQQIQPQVIHTVVQSTPVGDETLQQLANVLSNFSFDAIRSEINHKFDELRREFAGQAISAPNHEEETNEPATTATFQIETAKIPASDQETAPVPKKADYSDLIMSEDTDQDDTESESAGGIDIMALLSAQAKKMESISTIDMMEMYGEAFSEVTLEELEKYINKNHK